MYSAQKKKKTKKKTQKNWTLWKMRIIFFHLRVRQNIMTLFDFHQFFQVLRQYMTSIMYFQCSGASESEVVLQHLSESSRHLVVLGGGCVSDEKRPLEVAPRDAGRVYRTHVPQVHYAIFFKFRDLTWITGRRLPLKAWGGVPENFMTSKKKKRKEK